MNKQTKHLVCLVLVPFLGICLLAGCGGGSRADGGHTHGQSPQKQEERARQVADAWRGSGSAAAWRRGYYPMADAVQVPESGWHSQADKRAYETQNFALKGSLPVATTKRGKIDWTDGKALTRPLVGAEKAYQSFALNRSAGPRLTVTGAELGQTTIVTSRGTATVPAWLFTLEGYDTPLKRVAVTPSKLPQQPISQARQGSAGGLRSVPGLAGTATDGRSITVKAAHGACDDGPVVKALETDENVVLYASVKGAQTGPCSADLIEQNVKVELRKPLGDRILLDAFTGRPVSYGEPDGRSPSWT
ncbi:hypothetical protein ABT075_25925 [Streptomyces sp. NPDC002677]|uniref:hypothetical protein n=1 Tax=Streptomyces sp. NPDC002677 TaxID=3154774 RepID=UPI003323C446